MKQDDISILWQRYITACKKGIEPYFDADEIDALLDSFEEKDDFTHYGPLLKLGLRLHPDHPDLKIRQCKFHLYNEEYRQALDLLESIGEMNGQDVDADMIRLECYSALKMYHKVIEYIENLIKADCEYIEEIFEYLAPVLSDLEMTDEAKHFIQWGAQMFPDNIVLKDELCYLCEMEGDFEQAINICNELIDREPYSYDYWFTLGRLYSLAADFDNAIDAFDFALTCDDSDENLKILKAYCLFMNENYEKALEVYAEITNSEVPAGQIKSLMAECYIKMEEFEQAYRMLKEVVGGKDPATDDAEIYLSFIRCCLETGRIKEASQTLRKAADIFPDNVRVLSLLALNYMNIGKEDIALQITNKILQNLNEMHLNAEDDSEYKKLFEEGLFSNARMGEIAKYYKTIFQFYPEEMLAKTRYIPPENLTKEYLSDKSNSN
jgi:tetratricopeptide (TPR) repeat protein